MATVEHRLDDWKKRLIDLTRRNRLLHYKPTKTSSLALTEPTCTTVFQRLVVQGKSWRVWLPPEESEEDGIGGDIQLFDEVEQDLPTTSKKGSTSRSKQSGRRAGTPPKADEIVVKRIQRIVADPNQPVPLRWDAIFGVTAPVRKDLERSLLQLQRRSRTDYRERGVRVLYVTFGSLIWLEVIDSRPIVSPLLMCPVTLSSSQKDPFTIEPAEEELVLNPALDVKLRNDFRIELPQAPDDWDEISLQDYLEQVSEIVASRKWNVDHVGLIDLFSFHKLVMYNDLTKNASRISEHSLVRTLVGMEEKDGAQTEAMLPCERDIDRIQRPEQTYQVLDADSSQQACIQAVLQGHSIVLQGPPGTGKSQTIANVIAEMMARGKTVLFVAEKMAALEVVSKRLHDVGLGDLCLEAHSRLASKKEVIASLKAALDNDLQPQQRLSSVDIARLSELRNRLNTYILALHERRSPAQRSVYEVLGELARLHRVPGYTLVGANLLTMTSGEFARWESVFNQLRELWPVAQEGQQHPWFGCRAQSYTFEVKEKWRTRLRDLQDGLSQLQRHRAEAASAFGIPESDVFESLHRLVSLGRHLQHAPKIEPFWLESGALGETLADAQWLEERAGRYYQEKREFEQKYRPGFRGVPDALSTRLKEGWESLDHAFASPDSRGKSLFAARNELLRFVDSTLEWCRTGQATGRTLHQTFGLQGDDLTPRHTEQLAQLAVLCAGSHKPNIDWFIPSRFQSALQVLESMGPQVEEYRSRVQALTQRHGQSFWQIPFVGFVPLVDRWLSEYQRGLLENAPLATAQALFSSLATHTLDETHQLKDAGHLVQSWKGAIQELAELLGVSPGNIAPRRSDEFTALAKDVIHRPFDLPIDWNLPASWLEPQNLRSLRSFVASAQPLTEVGNLSRGRILERMKQEVFAESLDSWRETLLSLQERPEHITLVSISRLMSRWQALETNPAGNLMQSTRFLEEWCRQLATVTQALGLDVRSVTANDVPRLGELIELCLQTHLPERAWLDRTIFEDVSLAAREAQPLYQEYLKRRSVLVERYDEAIFALDLDGLVERFHRTSHKPPLSWVHPAYKNDRSAILRVLRSPQLPPTVSEDLVEAREVVRLQRRVKETFPKLQPLLGRYFLAEQTDFDAVLRAADVARKARPLLESGLKTESVLGLLSGTVSPSEAFRGAQERHLRALAHWKEVVPILIPLLPTQTLSDLEQLREIEEKLTQLATPVASLVEGYFVGLETQWAPFKTSLALVERIFTRTGIQPNTTLPTALTRLLLYANTRSSEHAETSNARNEADLQDTRRKIDDVLRRLNEYRATWNKQLGEWVRLCPLADLREGLACHNLRRFIEGQRPQMDEALGAYSLGIETNFDAIRHALRQVRRAEELWRSGPLWKVEGELSSPSPDAVPRRIQLAISGALTQEAPVTTLEHIETASSDFDAFAERGKRYLEVAERWGNLAER